MVCTETNNNVNISESENKAVVNATVVVIWAQQTNLQEKLLATNSSSSKITCANIRETPCVNLVFHGSYN